MSKQMLEYWQVMKYLTTEHETVYVSFLPVRVVLNYENQSRF